MKKEIISGVVGSLITAIVLWLVGALAPKLTEAQLDSAVNRLSKDAALAAQVERRFAESFVADGLKIEGLSEAPEGTASATGLLFLNTRDSVTGRIYALNSDGKEDSLRWQTASDGGSAIMPIRRGQRYRLESSNPKDVRLFLIYSNVHRTQ